MNRKTRIGVVTFYRDNYGAFLQAFALQKQLIQLDYKPELINFAFERRYTILGVPLRLAIKKPFFFLKRIMVELVLYREHKERNIIFKKAVSEHLIESKRCKSYKQLKECCKSYDVLLSGSDQVFNPNLHPQSLKYRMLQFVDGVKVTYAASAGSIENIVDKNKLAAILDEFSGLSMREESLKDLLANLLPSKTVYRHIDPTLLLSVEEWRSFAKKPEYLNEPYIFYYRVLSQEQLEIEAEELSNRLGIPVFAADGCKKFTNQIERKGYLTPLEWVGALLNADYVVTNSFHGTAFSVNFHKKACIVLPPKDSSRIVDLLDNCNLNLLLDIDSIISTDLRESVFDTADAYLSEQREQSKNYLNGFNNLLKE